ncbi:MAG: LPS export ABC transporter ATP-binding protein [Thermodesulfobacteriota bacterium]|nr:LPS export ABC transporter ATP-binding protein [Thermodesulfobacteriota bacterium]
MGTLVANNLVKSYRQRRVVDHVSIRVESGSIIGLLGPNGAGKTTTFYMIAGLIKPDEGQVVLNGEDLTHYPMYQRARRGITYLAQEPSVFRKLTVEENILAVLETIKLPREERSARLRSLLEELKIDHLARHKAYSLSGGERRRLEILRALAIQPSFILLDEPFAGIDPLAVSDLQAIVRQLKEKGLGILISDHNVRETLSVCDWAYILTEGRILEAGNSQHIAASEVARKIYLGEQFTL